MQSYQAVHLMLSVTNNDNDGLTPQSTCLVHANIKEKGIRVGVALCAGDDRKRHVYMSSTSEVDIRVIFDNGGIDTSRFIFIFEGNF